MSATTRDKQNVIGWRDRTRLLIDHMNRDRPMLTEVDDDLDDAILHLKAVAWKLASIMAKIDADLLRQDEIEAGDRTPDGEPVVYDRYP